MKDLLTQLPQFSFADFRRLMLALKSSGYRYAPVSEMPRGTSKTVYLRHDVDIFLTGWGHFAEFEADQNIVATYYVALSQFYNIFQIDNRKLLERLTDLGHEIGLHYDLRVYPESVPKAWDQLQFEVQILERLSGQKIKTISTHNPHLGGADPFKQNDEYVHPHDPRYQENLMYVSDSCRAWRDENLLQCFTSNPPDRLLLLMHLEGFLQPSEEDRVQYVKNVMLPEAVRPVEEFFDQEVLPVYHSHPAPKAHDAREAASKQENKS